MTNKELKGLAWVFVCNEGDTEVSLAYNAGFIHRRRLNLQTGRALYARTSRMSAHESEWIAVDERSGQPLVGCVS